MKTQFAAVVCAAVIGLMMASSPSFAQQKTVRACQAEWRANKAANQAAGITEKAYVEKCRAGGTTAQPAAKPTVAPRKPAAAEKNAPKKTVRACQAEWRANKAANQAAGITEKAYVEKCRAGVTAAQPAPITTQRPAPTKPAARRAPVVAPSQAPTTAGTPTGAKQFATEAQAKARCRGDTVVWVNLNSKIYHFSGYKDYGHTKKGAYMCERDTAAAGFRAAKNEKHP